jgi:hypothetical protein
MTSWHNTKDRKRYIAAMWIRFLLTPGHETAPGEPVDLGELGSVCEKNWTRLTPYSPAQIEPYQNEPT